MTTSFAGFSGLLVKEVKELLRERRLFVILLVLGGIASLGFSAALGSQIAYGYSPSPSDLVLPFVFILPIALIITSLTFAADCVSKEKDSGMLGLVLSSPVTHEGFLAAKIAGALVAYAAVAGFILVFVAVLALSFGWIILKAVAWFFLVPLLALWIFLLGVALVVSVTMGGSKSAVGVAISIYLPLFLIGPMFLGELIRSLSPRVYEYLEYNPIAMAIAVGTEISYGAPFRWAPVLVAVAAGILLMALAYFLFRRQEVAA